LTQKHSTENSPNQNQDKIDCFSRRQVAGILSYFKTDNEEKRLFYLILASSDTDAIAYAQKKSPTKMGDSFYTTEKGRRYAHWLADRELALTVPVCAAFC